MQNSDTERYVFNVEWFDRRAEVIRKYELAFYPIDQSISMVSKIILFLISYFSG